MRMIARPVRLVLALLVTASLAFGATSAFAKVNQNPCNPEWGTCYRDATCAQRCGMLYPWGTGYCDQGCCFCVL